MSNSLRITHIQGNSNHSKTTSTEKKLKYFYKNGMRTKRLSP